MHSSKKRTIRSKPEGIKGLNKLSEYIFLTKYYASNLVWAVLDVVKPTIDSKTFFLNVVVYESFPVSVNTMQYPATKIKLALANGFAFTLRRIFVNYYPPRVS